MADEQKEEWLTIDVLGLSKVLADEKWKEDTKTIPETVLYDLTTIKDPVTGSVEIVKEIASEWASKYFLLVDQFKELCLTFQKPTGYDDKSSSSQTRSEGTG